MGIDSLLRPRSIAIVGASDKVGPGLNAWKALTFVGYAGPVHLVNPRTPELFNQSTYASLDEIPGSVDAVFVAVNSDQVLEVARQGAAKGAGALAILSSGFGETKAGAEAEAELANLAASSGMAVCGPNCLGLLNFAGRTALFGTSLPDRVARGGIAVIAQSGSVGIALLNSARELGFACLITTGNEAVTHAADYIDALVNDDAVTVFVVFLEQVKAPDAFLRALRRARQANKPVIVLKSGRSDRGRAAVMAHTGAIAGSSEAFDAALRATGAIQVHSIDELVETALLASHLPRTMRVRGLAALSLSGGEIALALDTAQEIGASFVPLGSAREEIAGLLPPYAHLENPLDLTWAGLYDPEVAKACARALASQDDVGILLLLQDAPGRLGPQQAARYANLLARVAAGTSEAGKPLVALSHLSDEPHPDLARAARESTAPYVKGTKAGLSALVRWIDWAGAVPAHESSVSSEGTVGSARAALATLSRDRLPTETEARSALASYGLVGPQERLVQTPSTAGRAAVELGFPVVVKGLVRNVIHKSDAGLVKVGLRSVREVEEVAASMLARAREGTSELVGVLVQAQVFPVAELFVGARRDPQFGPLIVFGAGGVQVELYKDVAVRLAPIGEDEALAALASTKVARLLEGFRGSPVGDARAAACAISAVSAFAADFRDSVEEVEINPLAVLPDGHGCLALDCVIVPREVMC